MRKYAAFNGDTGKYLGTFRYPSSKSVAEAKELIRHRVWTSFITDIEVELLSEESPV